MRPLGVIAILIIIFSMETGPVPKFSITCSKTGIITSDNFSWWIPFQTRVMTLMRPLG